MGPSVIPKHLQSRQDTVRKVDSASAFLIDPYAHPLQVSEVQVGQHVQLVTASQTNRELNGTSTSCSGVAGTIVSVDDQRILLRDAVKILQGSRMTGTPIVNKVPYFSRLFKNSGSARESVAIPGEVSIARSEILLAGELSNSGVETLNQVQQFERIGIDFE